MLEQLKRAAVTLAAAAVIAAIGAVTLAGQVGYFAILATSDANRLTLPAGLSDTLVAKTTTDTLTNKTLDAEGTGNVVSLAEKFWIRAAWCQNATPATNWDLPTTNAATTLCNTGTNTQKGVLDFVDGANTISAQWSQYLPADFTATGGVDIRLKWYAGTATTGNVVWNAQLACVADAETSDPAFGTATAVTDAAKGTVNQDNDVTFTNISTATGTCAAGELMYIKIARDSNNGSDTMTDTAHVRGIELTFRRAM